MLVARASPDGYTLLQATSTTMAVNVTLAKKLAYDPAKDFVPVALLTASPFVLTVSADSAVKSVADLIALAKARPGELNYGSAGPGTMHHLSTELMLSLTGTRMQHVPYKATPPALTDLLAGRLQVLFGDGPSVVPQIREGKLRALAVSTAKRSPATPDVPTMQEAGIAGFESAAWQMIVAPAGTPAEIVTLLNKEVGAIFSERDVIEELTNRGMGPQVTGTPDELRAYRARRDRSLVADRAARRRGRDAMMFDRARCRVAIIVTLGLCGVARAADPVISDAKKADHGFVVHNVQSEYQAGTTQIFVRAPAKPRGGPLLALYVLPVEPHDEKRWGDARAEIAKLNIADRYGNGFGVVCVFPTFSHLPWFADHPSDPQIRQETYFLNVVLPFIERTLSGGRPTGSLARCSASANPAGAPGRCCCATPMCSNGPPPGMRR